jgi:hypothetical protein
VQRYDPDIASKPRSDAGAHHLINIVEGFAIGMFAAAGASDDTTPRVTLGPPYS